VAWPDLADLALTSTRDLLGEAASYVPKGALAAEAVTVIFNEADANAVLLSDEVGAIDVANPGPAAGVRISDLSSPPTRGDRLTVRGRTYHVDEVRLDGSGGARLRLSEALA
jgi:hypothetical protein